MSHVSCSPEAERILRELADVLLRAPGTFAPADRELIATYVSWKNACTSCQRTHGALAARYLGGNGALVEQVKRDFEQAAIGEKLKSLLRIAGKVQRAGRNVQRTDIERAQAAGATDAEIHDTVLIAAALCMYNRYADGLAPLAHA